MELQDTVKIINEAAFEVRKNLAPGYLESVYKNALFNELTDRGLKAETEAQISVNYKGHNVGFFRADLLVEGQVIIELKATSVHSSAHEAQLINYLKATGIEKGILINYGGEKFVFREKDRIYKPNKT